MSVVDDESDHHGHAEEGDEEKSTGNHVLEERKSADRLPGEIDVLSRVPRARRSEAMVMAPKNHNLRS